MSKVLIAVTRAANARRNADTRYRAALQAARDAGHSFTEIGAAAGITRVGARYLLHPDPRKAER